jgi:hypothetical protein
MVRDLLADGKSDVWVLKALKNENRIDRFKREIAVLSRLRSSHIAQIEHWGVEPGPFFVTRYLGKDLEKLPDLEEPSALLKRFRGIVTAARDAHFQGANRRLRNSDLRRESPCRGHRTPDAGTAPSTGDFVGSLRKGDNGFGPIHLDSLQVVEQGIVPPLRQRQLGQVRAVVEEIVHDPQRLAECFVERDVRFTALLKGPRLVLACPAFTFLLELVGSVLALASVGAALRDHDAAERTAECADEPEHGHDQRHPKWRGVHAASVSERPPRGARTRLEGDGATFHGRSILRWNSAFSASSVEAARDLFVPNDRDQEKH